jgi:tetraacyldisaccharide 4'-kinase
MRAQIDQRLPSIWQHRGLLAWLLAPASALFSAMLRLRTAAYAIGLAPSHHLPVPVIVIGNLYLGGTGKTPLTIELVRALGARGWRPGVVSRGYGRGGDEVRCVRPDDDPHSSGDEPLLIVRATNAPLAIGRRRMAAAHALLREHPDCDCIVSDDGLQHLVMARDLELAVIDARGLGNGWVLPAGPLRDPARRLASVDAIVAHEAAGAVPSWVTAPCFSMRSRLGAPWQLARPTLRRELAEFGSAQKTDGLRITAAAGIGVPARFFAMLRAAGLTIDELPLPDHYDFRIDPFASVAADCILITEKDAVKCSADERLRRDERIWVAPLAADIDPELIEFVLARLRQAQKEKLRGPAPA